MTGAEDGASGARAAGTNAAGESARNRRETAAALPREGHEAAARWDRSLMPNGDPPALTLWGVDDLERRASLEA